MKKKIKEEKEEDILKEIYCYDCQTKIEFNGEEILNGKMLMYKVNGEEIAVFKCNKCAEEIPELKDYQDCEVYSRVVGYIRPVQKWNIGKVAEYVDRKEFDIPNNLD